MSGNLRLGYGRRSKGDVTLYRISRNSASVTTVVRPHLVLHGSHEENEIGPDNSGGNSTNGYGKAAIGTYKPLAWVDERDKDNLGKMRDAFTCVDFPCR